MFKVKTLKMNKAEVLKKLDILETKEYKYLLTDSPNLCEVGKINIVFEEQNIEEVAKIVKQIILGDIYYVNVYNHKGAKPVNVSEIQYFEALDNDVFAIIDHERYYMLEKLYVLDDLLLERNFVRISKSFLVNITKISFIKPILNYKLKLIMLNNDTLEVNRTYVKSFKERLKLR